MFSRRTSQKPSDDFFKKFQSSFPELNSTSATTSSSITATTTTTTTGPPSNLTDALDLAINPTLQDSAEARDGEPNSRSNEPWTFSTGLTPSQGLTPSVMDPTSHDFNMFAQQMPHYYTPTPGGTGTSLQALTGGNLRTPDGGAMGGMGTPLSLPTSEAALHAGHHAGAFGDFHPHHLNHHDGSNPYSHGVNPMHMHHHHHHQQQQTGFAPHHFTHQPSFDGIDGHMGDSPIDDMGMEVNLPASHSHSQHSPPMMFQSHALQNALRPPLPSTGETFRYHTTLNAATAMVRSANEIPLTYLNKCQAYTLTVQDTQNPHASVGGARYRTFVRVSFDDDRQRLRPAACWQLWKEGRGTSEAHQHGGRLQAVEYVENGGMTAAGDDPNKPLMKIESASFDGFCVTWSPPPNGNAECAISVRFNFLSTDFSHSKGVKGIPVRLCAKTEMLDETSSNNSHLPQTGPEVCYCTVKLFRDHGAERKLSNDIAHVKKNIEKVSAQIAQLEAGQTTASGKRKRAGSISKGAAGGAGVNGTGSGVEGRPAKVPKHSRTWSLSSVASGSGRGTLEDDLHLKYRNLQDMFSSTRPASVLHLRGDKADDPDLAPVKLEGPPSLPVHNESGETTGESVQIAASSSEDASPSATPPSDALSGHLQVGSSSYLQQQQQQSTSAFPQISRTDSLDWRQTSNSDLDPQFDNSNNPQHLATPTTDTTTTTSPIKIQTRSSDPTSGTKYIETLGLDPTYRPPQPLPQSSSGVGSAAGTVACFYIQPRVTGRKSPDRFYRAIYLPHRTQRAFIRAAAPKSQIPAHEVLRIIRITKQGLHVLFDDECVKELPEGQDMVAEFCEFSPEMPAGKFSSALAAASTTGAARSRKRKRDDRAESEKTNDEDGNGNDEEGAADGSASASPEAEKKHPTAYELRLMY